jgi:hypothetical protein
MSGDKFRPLKSVRLQMWGLSPGGPLSFTCFFRHDFKGNAPNLTQSGSTFYKSASLCSPVAGNQSFVSFCFRQSTFPLRLSAALTFSYAIGGTQEESKHNDFGERMHSSRRVSRVLSNLVPFNCQKIDASVIFNTLFNVIL